MGLDLASSWVIWFFGACAVGGVAGLMLGKLFGFEFGLGVGLLVPGVVSLSFTVAFVTEYRDFRDNPSRADGVVVAIEDRPANAAGDITTPVAVLEFSAADGRNYRATSKGGSSLRTGGAAVVVYDASDPTRAKVGQPRELFGGAIASMLFGTFPASAAIFFLVGWLDDKRQRVPTRREVEHASKPTNLTPIANLLMVGGLLGAGLWPGSVMQQTMVAFGVVSLGLWLHCADGFLMGRDLRWSLGIGVLAINFSAWVLALWLLIEPASQW